MKEHLTFPTVSSWNHHHKVVAWEEETTIYTQNPWGQSTPISWLEIKVTEAKDPRLVLMFAGS